MEPEKGGPLLVGLTTPNADVEGRPLVGPMEGLATVVTIEATTALTTGAEEATQIVGKFGTNVTGAL